MSNFFEGEGVPRITAERGTSEWIDQIVAYNDWLDMCYKEAHQEDEECSFCLQEKLDPLRLRPKTSILVWMALGDPTRTTRRNPHQLPAQTLMSIGGVPVTIDPKRYDQAVMQAAILEAVMDALAGKPVSDFMESFDEVDKARFAREALETIADPATAPMTLCREAT